MEFHISRSARERYEVDDALFSYTGNVVFADVSASRRLAQQINDVRGAAADPKKAVHGAALFAMGLIDELSHALIASFRADKDPELFGAALNWFGGEDNGAGVAKLLHSFTDTFPNTTVFRGEKTPEEWLSETVDGFPNRQAAMEELLLLWLANFNPALKPFRELVDDTSLAERTIYKRVVEELPAFFATRPRFSAKDGTLLDALLAPILASPDSLSGQLDFIRERWAPLLGDRLRSILLAMDVLKEEEIAIWRLFNPGAVQDRWGRAGGKGWRDEGFEGDEFVGFGAGRGGYGAQQKPLHEYEAFSQDQAWMPNVVLIAKSTYVWLEQLSKKYQRHIFRLDQIPDEELRLLAGRGLSALWLIGLWERSSASQTIKRLRGQHDAVASAYSLKDYRIADDIGGNEAYERLRERAWAAGLRLASDMVPNHMGIDSNWVMEHPDWFVSRDESPFPSYSFEGPDLSSDSRYEIKLEDHYYDQSDAAVVFRLRSRSSGHAQFVYHGNDGTTFAWNDTAQLDYSKAFVREQVMQAILHVARMFPIIRFDAAMVLAKKHVQRLWFPLPGMGGSIPSRAENAMSQEEFDALMPNEFWREVVDRVAVEVPGTLLLAEAFWLLEGYFVRTLGMHRVYNSAFMNMLRDEENAKYRSYLKKTIEFDPEILKRYVNFMSNPDERTAIDQFGTGDKYFGTAVMLATIPGLPMFGHGQVEAFTEKYGMEYKQARFEEWPNEDLVARHMREIAPLLKQRHIFADSADFVLYDFWTAEGHVDENVFVYSNRCGNDRSLVLFNNVYGSTHGTLHTSAASMNKATGELQQRNLTQGLGLPVEDQMLIGYRDVTSQLEYIRRSTSLAHDGLTVPLRGYQYAALLHWRELRATAEQPWDQLCDALDGAGVHSLDESLSKLRLLPVHDALRHVLAAEAIESLVKLSHEPDPEASALVAGELVAAPKRGRDERNGAGAAAALPATHEGVRTFAERAAVLHQAVEAIAPGSLTAPAAVARATADFAEELFAATRAPRARRRAFPGTGPHASRGVLPSDSAADRSIAVWAPVVGWALVRRLAATPAQAVEAFDTLQLRSAMADIFSSFGSEGDHAWRAASRVRVLLLAESLGGGEPATQIASGAFWEDPDVRWLAGVNEAGGKTYVNKELAEELLWWLQLPATMRPADDEVALQESLRGIESETLRLAREIEASGYEVSRLVAVAEERTTATMIPARVAARTVLTPQPARRAQPTKSAKAPSKQEREQPLTMQAAGVTKAASGKRKTKAIQAVEETPAKGSSSPRDKRSVQGTAAKADAGKATAVAPGGDSRRSATAASAREKGAAARGDNKGAKAAGSGTNEKAAAPVSATQRASETKRPAATTQSPAKAAPKDRTKAAGTTPTKKPSSK